MPRTRKTRRGDDGTAKWHEDLVKQHYLSMKKGKMPEDRTHFKSDAEYMKYLRDVKKYLRSQPKTAGRRRRQTRRW